MSAKIRIFFAYVTAKYGNGLAVVDISNPASPSVTGSLIDSTNLAAATDLAVVDNYAYVTAQSGNRVTGVDISSPAAPTVLESQSIYNISPANGLISGGYLYVAAGGLKIYQVTTQIPPNQDENANVVSYDVWTGTDTSGNALSDTCSDWTSGGGGSGETTAGSGAVTGKSSFSGPGWTDYTNYKCGSSLHLYCFEQ